MGGGGGGNGGVRVGLIVKVRFGGTEGVGHAGDLGQWFSTWGNCAPPGEFGNTWKMLLVSNGYHEARDASPHPAMHRTAPTAKNCLAPNVDGAEVEKS